MATALMAQAGPDRAGRTPPSPEQMLEHRVQRLTTLLSLDTAQQQQARMIFSDERKAAQAQQESLRSTRQALQAAVQAASPDPQLDTLAAQVGVAEGQLLAIHAKAQVRLRLMLNATQKEKLDSMRGGFGGGPGGRMGFGGHGPMRHRGPGL